MKALILAAGFGTRLQPYTRHTPKALFPIAGRPLLETIIWKLARAGCTAVMINTHHLHRQIEAFAAAGKFPLPVSIRHEPRILGTGGAIRNLADFWDAHPFMVINADIVFDIDLREVYTAHCRQHPAATLVLCDDPAFNSVAVDQEGKIRAFCSPTSRRSRPAGRLMTFTGIQVLNPEVLDYIPQDVPSASIEAYRRLMADGKPVQAFVVPPGRWSDLGTPQAYRAAVLEKAVPAAFIACSGLRPEKGVQWEKLKGDGSERQWYRLRTENQSLIMVDHGIRTQPGIQQVDAFVQIGRHLARHGIAVPKIYHQEPFCGLVFLQDLGNVHLQQRVQTAGGRNEVRSLYRRVIDQLVLMSRNAVSGFDRRWAYQGSRYDRTLILEKECRYFVEAFLVGYLGWNIRFGDLEKEFERLAGGLLEHASIGFMHRDLQSRNIMVKNDRPYLIDFQGARLGPIQYDLAALLVDPYVQLPSALQEQLLDDCLARLSIATPAQRGRFTAGYHYCALARSLQILGAFAHLSKNKGKHHFEAYIPPAVSSLRCRLSSRTADEFPALTAVVEKVWRQLPKCNLKRRQAS